MAKKISFDDFMKVLKTASKEKPEKADAIIWLQGDRYDRGKKVLGLFKRGFAKKIVLTGNNVLVGENKTPGANDIDLIEMRRWLEKQEIKSKDIIIDDKSFNTTDQAKNVLKLAMEKGWKKIILVVSFYHQPRVFLTFLARAEKIGWKGKIINQPTKINWQRKPGGRNKKAKELVLEEIQKINKYKLWI